MLLLLTDIWGINESVQVLSDAFNKVNVPHIMLSPYDDLPVFEDEAQAYAHFKELGGIQSFQTKVERLLVQRNEPQINILGFSAGGSVAWRLAAQHSNIAYCICFYPGQIRHDLALIPRNPVDIIFPKSESHFELDPVIHSLSKTINTRVIKTSYSHGFANAQTPNYDAIQFGLLKNLIEGSVSFDIESFANHYLKSNLISS